MASCKLNKRGKFRIRFTLDGKEKEMQLPTADKKVAETICGMVERLVEQKQTGEPDRRLSSWLRDIPDDLRRRLERAGLVEESPDRKTLADLKALVFSSPKGSEGTRVNWNNYFNFLFRFKPDSFPIRNFTPEMALEFSRFAADNYKAGNSANKTVSAAKTFFKQACIVGWIEKNPFEHIGAPTKAAKRETKITRVSVDDMERLFCEYHNKKWLAIISLMRFGGLRGAREMENLFWDIDSIRWSTAEASCTITVECSKLEGKSREVRIVPLPPQAEKALLDWLQTSKADETPNFPHCRMFPEIHQKLEALREKYAKQVSEGKMPKFKIEVNLDTMIKRAFNSIGIALGRAYDLRKNCCSDWLTPDENGNTIDIIVYESIAGHDIQTGKKYYQILFPERLNRGFEQVSRRWTGGNNGRFENVPGIVPGIVPVQVGNLDNLGLQSGGEPIPQVLKNQGFLQERKMPCYGKQGKKLPQVGFEPITLGSEDRCAIQLRH